MLKMETVIHGDVQKRLRFAMALIRHLASLKLERLTRRKESNLWHFPDYSGAVLRSTPQPLYSQVFREIDMTCVNREKAPVCRNNLRDYVENPGYGLASY
jgi:hypothetical protein